VGNISRVSEVRRVALDKLKGTLVDFNSLEHVLDDVDGLGPWQIELRKVHDDPFECDEIVVHASAERAAPRDELERTISRRFVEATELRPNRFEWHSAAAMREKHGVGRLLKEEKLVDHRARAGNATVPELKPNPTYSADDSPAVLI
jgi:hypothetical protein